MTIKEIIEEYNNMMRCIAPEENLTWQTVYSRTNSIYGSILVPKCPPFYNCGFCYDDEVKKQYSFLKFIFNLIQQGPSQAVDIKSITDKDVGLIIGLLNKECEQLKYDLYWINNYGHYGTDDPSNTINKKLDDYTQIINKLKGE